MNKRIVVGVILTIAMLMIAFFGPELSPHKITDQLKMTYIPSDNGGTLIAPPLPPGPEYPFGTDKNGYDMMTRIFHGAKYTVLTSVIIAFLRVFIGGLIGLFMGFSDRSFRSSSQFQALGGIPMFIVVYFVLFGINVNPTLSSSKLVVITAVVFVILGIPSVTATVQNKTKEIRKRLFVLAAESLGAGRGRLMLKHIFPHLKESFLILFLNEIILSLTIFGQLGIFNLFLGGTLYISGDEPPSYYSMTNEWAGLIGMNRQDYDVFEWMLLFPLASYMVLILGIYLISKGLESNFRKVYSRYMQI